MRSLYLLGATGSIGRQVLDVADATPGAFRIAVLTADTDIETMTVLIQKYQPEFAAMNDAAAAETLAMRFPDLEIGSGKAGLVRAAAWNPGDKTGLLVNAIVGVAGLEPTIAALGVKRTVALANKETLVVGGAIVMELARKNGVAILPVDSEHSAIWQCLNGEDLASVERLIITASGGAFRDKTRAELAGVTPAEALCHPNWNMGRKITIDSATMMNKGFEVIEAMHLFGLPLDRIDCVLHRESYVHSLVEFIDGSLIAQISSHDMRLPISYALHHPTRTPNPTARLDLAHIGELSFAPIDFDRYPCLRYAYEAAARGGNAPAALNAANEVAVALFLAGTIPFLTIEAIVHQALAEVAFIERPTLAELLETDAAVRTAVTGRYPRPNLI